MIVWEDEDIINNTALESEWAAVATATQNLPTDTSAGCSRIKSNQNRIHFAPHRARMRTHTNNILNSQTQNREEAPSAPTCCFHCPVVYCEKKKRGGEKGAKKKQKKTPHSSCPELVGVKGSIPSAYSLRTMAKKKRLRLPFRRHPPSQCRQITEKGGRQRLKARTINFPGESVHSAWRARVTFR